MNTTALIAPSHPRTLLSRELSMRSERPLAEQHRTASFEELFEENLHAAYGLALHMLGNREDAEDVVQEAALLAFRAFSSFRPGTNFRAWLFRILTNVVRQRYRRARQAPPMLFLDDTPSLDTALHAAATAPGAPRTDPADLVLSKLDTDAVTRAISSLPEEFRLAAALCFLSELSYEAIAEILECPVGTVRSRLHRGRKLLRAELAHLLADASATPRSER